MRQEREPPSPRIVVKAGGRTSPRGAVRSKSTAFTAVVVETPTALADEAAGIFVGYGALGCEIKSRRGGRQGGAGGCSQVCAYFADVTQKSLERIIAMLTRARMLAPTPRAPQIERIEDPGWATMWQKRFEPFPIGDRLLIVPPWERKSLDGRIAIIIRPGQAFGTGHHASTYGVLMVLEQLAEEGRAGRALDVGTGSGILAIAMRKLGAGHVTAIDRDSVALENAQENAALNGVARAIRFSAAPLNSIRGRFDLITANILSSVLIEMAPRLKARLNPGGCLVLAGILAREAEQVAAAYAPELTRRATRADGVWRSLLFQL